MTEPIIEVLRGEWASFTDLVTGIGDDEWAQPTALPGWSVQDNVSHVIGIECMLLGDPAPDVDVSHLAHVANAFAAATETWVEARRGNTPATVLAELAEVIARRDAQLMAMTDDDLARVGWSPVGEVPYRVFMQVRVFDTWMHEQDIRRAVGRPGHLAGPAVDVALDRIQGALGFVVGKKAGAPDGASVRFEVQGPVPHTYCVVVDGRAQVVDPATAPRPATVTLTLPIESFVALGGGRWSHAEAVAAGGLTIAGDDALATAVLDNLAFTP